MEPNPTNGVITGYTIQCNTSSGFLSPWIIDGSEGTTILYNLTTFTEYTCSISANTSAGESVYSDAENATTDEDCKICCM